MTADRPRVCAQCGQSVEGPDYDFRFRLPDPVFELPEAEQEQRIWDGGDFVGASGVGVFVRVLLRVALTEDCQITYGTWLGVLTEEDFDRAQSLWHDPEYPSLVLDGVLANAIEPWGRSMMTPVRVAVRDPGQVPYVEAMHDEAMSKILTDTWSRSWVLSAMPDGAWHSHSHSHET
jgi:hypothetical protein